MQHAMVLRGRVYGGEVLLFEDAGSGAGNVGDEAGIEGGDDGEFA
jgi:hypothetical protein